MNVRNYRGTRITPEMRAKALDLYFIQKMQQTAIAARLGVGVSTVRVWIRAQKKRKAEATGEEWPDTGDLADMT